MAPNRGTTLSLFVEKASVIFDIEIDKCEIFNTLMTDKIKPQFLQKTEEYEDMIPHLIKMTLKKDI